MICFKNFTCNVIILLVFLALSTGAFSENKNPETPIDILTVPLHATPVSENIYNDDTSIVQIPYVPLGYQKSFRSQSPGLQIGLTAYDLQNTGRMNRQVDWRSNQMVHFAWTQKFDFDMHNDRRWTAYQAWDPVSAQLLFTSGGGGCPIHDTLTGKSGYTGLDVTDDGRAVLTNHFNLIGREYVPSVWYDSAAGNCRFIYFDSLPDSTKEYGVPAETDYFLFPSMEYQVWNNDTVTHVFARASSGGIQPENIHYFRRLGSPESGLWDYPPVIVDTTHTYGHVVTASRVSGRVALVWLAPPGEYPGDPESLTRDWMDPGLGPSQRINDVYYMSSPDLGNTWGAKTNVSAYDSTQGGFLGHCDLSALIDSDDRLHIVWDARSVIPAAEGLGEYANFWGSYLLHWDDLNNSMSIIKDADWDIIEYQDDFCTGGGWNEMSIVKPQISECDGRFYVVFVQFHDLYNGIYDDCADARWTWGYWSGTANGELYVSVSENGGLSWDMARNLTDSYTPHCDTAEGSLECDSDMWPSISRFGMEVTSGDFSGVDIVDPSGSYSGNYYLDILYINDKFPGAVVYDDGIWTMSPLKWFRLPCIDPVLAPQLAVFPDEISEDTHTKPGVELDTIISLQNIGNADLQINSITDIEFDQPQDNWLAVDTSGPINLPHNPPGSYDLHVYINYNGNITNGPYELNGIIIIDSDAPSSPDTIPIHVFIADTILTAPAGPGIYMELSEEVNLLFEYIYQEGTIAMARTSTGPEPPEYYRLVPEALPEYFNFLTTFDYYVSVDICINYDDSGLSPEDENDLRLLEAQWSDITSSLDTNLNEICGHTDSLTTFAVGILDLPPYVCGDANGDGLINILDVTYLVYYFYRGGQSPPNVDSTDADSINGLNNHDAVHLVCYLYNGGAEPYCPPFPDSILEITDDTLELRNTAVLPDQNYAKVDLFFKGTDPIAGFSFPCSFECPTSSLNCDSISFAGSIYDAGLFLGSAIDNSNHEAVLGFIDLPPFVDTGGPAASLWFSLTPSEDTQYINIDTTTYDPGHIVIFSKLNPELHAFIPTIVNIPVYICIDSDGDGFGDPEYPENMCEPDNCPDIYNPGQQDRDNDGLGNVCDECTDSDNDGYGNPGYPYNTCPDDNCPYLRNPDQADLDNDGLGDACDPCTDQDGDGYGDPDFFYNSCPDDNCPTAFNSDQEDGDADGKGDACDPAEMDFTADHRCGSPPLTVSFTDLSDTGGVIASWLWDFGDGDTSIETNPIHVFDESGVFDIRLIVSDGIFCDTLTKDGYITTQDSVSAEFVGFPKSGKAPLTVVFEPILEGIATEYYWDFGDGDTSSLRNPIHVYQSEGAYDVKLRVRLELDDCSQIDSLIKTEYVTASELKIDFSAAPRAGIAPLNVQFTDKSQNAVSWLWNFGDGDTSEEQNPQHQYDTASVYNVSLHVTDDLGHVDSLLKLEYIFVDDTLYPDLFAENYDVGARPGFDFSFYSVWTNLGTADAENCTLKVLPPEEMTFYTVVPGDSIISGTYTGFSLSGDTVIIPLDTIAPSEWSGGYVKILGNLSEFTPIGDTLEIESWLTSTSIDQDDDNNYSHHAFEVTGSIDPNDKLAAPGGKSLWYEILQDQRITYTIQFENKPEATAEAIYVRVADTLDENLDWSSISIGNMSHPDNCEYDFDPYTGIVTWFCDSIMLPPNVNPPEGEGYFTFSISPKTDLDFGTEISNTAWIRFDYNAWLQAPEDGPIVRVIAAPYTCGDVNDDDLVNLLDITYLIGYLYMGGPPPYQMKSGDVSNDGTINLLDITYLIAYLYKGGPEPNCP